MTSAMSRSYINAARHYLALQDDNSTIEEITSALDWIEESIDNKDIMDRISKFDRICKFSINVLESNEIPSTASWRWWRIARYARPAIATVSLVMIAGLAVMTSFHHAASPRNASGNVRHYASNIASIKTIYLPDGSRMALGGKSEVTVSYDLRERRISLIAGEAFFSVKKDRSRPFLVESANGTTRALGTAFEVHRGDDGIAVSVAHGTVSVVTRGKGKAAAAVVKGGMQISYTSDGRLSPLTRIDPGQVGAWRRGRLRFVDRPLAAAVQDINRYTAKPLLIATPRLEQQKISASLRVDGIAQWIQALAKTIGADVVESRDAVIFFDRASGERPTEDEKTEKLPLDSQI